jgi:hypothetical protein
MDLIRFIFACFGIFANTISSHHLLQNIRTDSHTNIRFEANKYMLQRIFASERIYAKGDSVTRFFASGFFPQAPDFTIRVVSNFSKIHGDIRSSMFATGVVDTGVKWKNLQSEKFL